MITLSFLAYRYPIPQSNWTSHCSLSHTSLFPSIGPIPMLVLVLSLPGCTSLCISYSTDKILFNFQRISKSLLPKLRSFLRDVSLILTRSVDTIFYFTKAFNIFCIGNYISPLLISSAIINST